MTSPIETFENAVKLVAEKDRTIREQGKELRRLRGENATLHARIAWAEHQGECFHCLAPMRRCEEGDRLREAASDGAEDAELRSKE